MPGSLAPSPIPLAPPATEPKPPRRLRSCWALTAASFILYILGNLVEGPGGLLLAAVGASACGWAWLLARALFDASERDARWPLAVVAVLTASGIGAHLLGDGSLGRMLDNIYGLAGSAALLLTFVEPLQGWRRDLPTVETRFRAAFLIVYTALVAVSILLLRGGGSDAVIKTACAATGLLAGGAAVWFRARHPIAVRARPVRPATATEDDARLAQHIERLLREEEIYATPDLKVADLARRLGQPEYRVTQCITGAMGFPNFNRLINRHRIDRARRMLTDQPERPILPIAFDCGFNSIGPFNRAFKHETGLTPRTFRAAALQSIED